MKNDQKIHDFMSWVNPWSNQGHPISDLAHDLKLKENNVFILH